jgi:hypothetical protein
VATSNAAKLSKSSSGDSSVHENRLSNSSPSDDQDPVFEPDKFSLMGIAFATATKLTSSIGVACAGPDVGTCAATDFQYHTNKVLNPIPLTRSRHLRRSGRRGRVFGSQRSHRWRVFASRDSGCRRVLAGLISGVGCSPTSVLTSSVGSPSFPGHRSRRLLHHLPSIETSQRINIY